MTQRVGDVAARIRTIPSWQVTLGLALLALGFLIAAQLRAEGPRIRYTTQERSPLVETVSELQSQQESLKDQILSMRAKIQEVEERGQGSNALLERLNAELARAKIAAGLTPLTGTGLVFQLEDSTQPTPPGGNDADYLVTARDVRAVVEELWLAGTEAVAVNGERITATSAIVDVGPSILVNSAYLSPPYQISAIGPTGLLEKVTAQAGFVEFVHARAETYGIRVSFLEPPSVDVPAFAGTVTLRVGRVAPSASPTP